jgi:small-conductance mechanosensitive channel
MEEKIKKAYKKIVLIYFIMYGAALAMGFLIYYSNTLNQNLLLNANQEIALSSLVIMYIMISIPLSLGGFYWLTKKWIALPDKEERLVQYTKFAQWRLFIIGFGFILGIFAFYVLKENSMLYSAGMSAIALVFCKPTLSKISNDLELDNDDN